MLSTRAGPFPQLFIRHRRHQTGLHHPATTHSPFIRIEKRAREGDAGDFGGGGVVGGGMSQNVAARGPKCVQRGVRPRPERHQTVRVPDLKSGPSYSAILPRRDRLVSVSEGVMGAQGVIRRTPTPRVDRPPDPCCPHHLGTKSPDHTVAPAPRRANATWYMYEVSVQRAASVGGAGGPVEGARWRGRGRNHGGGVGSQWWWEGNVPVLITRCHPSTSARLLRLIHRRTMQEGVGSLRARARRAAAPVGKRRASSLNVHGRPYAQVPILQPNVCNGVANVAHASIHAPKSSPVSPPQHTAARGGARGPPDLPVRRGGGGGDCWGGLVAPPLEQLARVHAVYGSRLIRTEMQLLPSNPHGVSSLRKRTTGGAFPSQTHGSLQI